MSLRKIKCLYLKTHFKWWNGGRGGGASETQWHRHQGTDEETLGT